ncbi:DUF4832 domain-containing protein, partial [Mariniphaga sediminis]|uniref:DUF4832 domain-containing protein n=1 Tax=Mariniphaga sediminis TaxID=1628158 RepID=UPI00356A3975
IGFTTFNHFNGDKLIEGLGWTQENPIVLQDFDGSLEMENHPMASIAYFRFHWKFIEPEIGKYNWELIDTVLRRAHRRNQTLLIRIAPYGSIPERDVPEWYRSMVGPKSEWPPIGKKWMVDPEDQRYALYYGRMIKELGKRYDGHPDIEAVDLSIVGAYGEGAGTKFLTEKTRETLVDAYTDNFKKTPLITLLTNGDYETNRYALSRADVGWRVDCIGDLGFWGENTHMHNFYPQMIINSGMKDAWKKAPVHLEACGTIEDWYGGKGTCKYCQGYTADDVNYIIDETLKWHISSFNNKFTAVPEEWRPLIDRWLKKMGYRFVLKSFSYPETVEPNGKLSFQTWWDNKGVAPCYKKFLLALKLENESRADILLTDADITTWLPGDNLYDDAVFIPRDMPAGVYNIKIGIVDRQSYEPKIKLAIEGRDQEGWYLIGKVNLGI